MKSVCIFASSSEAIDRVYFTKTAELAETIAKLGYNLVFGAGKIGLMGESARIFKKHGREIIGIIPKKLNLPHVAYEECDELIITENMSERKNLMVEKSGFFIAVPGGFGTLEEILEIVTLKQLGYINKPIVFCLVWACWGLAHGGTEDTEVMSELALLCFRILKLDC